MFPLKFPLSLKLWTEKPWFQRNWVWRLRGNRLGMLYKCITSETNEICKRNVMLSLEVPPKFEVVNWKALDSEELGRMIAWGWFMYVVQVYYKRNQWNMQKKNYVSLEVPPKFEVVNWKALVSEELGMEIAWESFRYVVQVYYKRNQWKYARGMLCYPLKFPLSLKLWTEKPWFQRNRVWRLRGNGSAMLRKCITSETNEICKRNLMLFLEVTLKFEVVNWKALVLEELSMRIAWEWFMYVFQVYHEQNQWNMQEK